MSKNKKWKKFYDLNTSHVKVKHVRLQSIQLNVLNLNTSHVKVKRRAVLSSLSLNSNLNTSHVKVKL